MNDKMRYFIIVICLIIAGFILKPVEASEIDPSVVGEIIINSDLVICKSNVCRYYDEPLKVLEHDQVFPDGYMIIYPVGIGTKEEHLAASKHVQEYWFQYIRSK